MAEVIRMPKMSDTMTEGVIAAWHKKVGDKVKSGEILAEVETDKATMELESYETGTLLYIGVQVKSAVPIDAVIAIVGEQGENIDELLKGLSGGSTVNAKSSTPTETPVKETPKTETPSVDLSSIKAEVIRMPKMSDTMTEGTIVAWHKKVGDKVKSGQLLAEVATDKATMEMESYSDGTLLYIGIKEGESVIVDGVMCIIGEEGTDYAPLLAASSSKKSPAVTEEKKETTSNTVEVKTTQNNGSSDARLKASPLAKKLAKDKGIDISNVQGTGENGRIVRRDVEDFKEEKSSGKTTTPATTQGVVGQESYEEIAVSQMRKTIARRLGESLFTAPHFFLTMEINMDKAMEARASMNEVASVKISFNDMVIKAVAAALRKHPKVNSSWLGDKIRFNHHIHIGVAMAVEEGLLVPVLKFADNKSLTQIATEVKDFSGKAKSKKLTPAEMSGNTFTISNLGMFGIDEFTAIINPPDACILAVGGIKPTVVPAANGGFKATNVMKVTLSCDHRAVDGAVGSAFLQTLKSYLEDPVRILI